MEVRTDPGRRRPAACASMLFLAAVVSLAATCVAAADGARESGPMLTLDLRDATVPEIVRAIGGAAGVAIELRGETPDVRLNLSCRDMRLDGVLRLLGKAAGLGWHREDDTYILEPAAPGAPEEGRLNADTVDVSVAELLLAVGRAAGVQVALRSEVGEATVSLSVRDMPLDRVLDLIARAAGLKWHRQGEIYVFEPAAEPE
jgi:hypothetical protein